MGRNSGGIIPYFGVRQRLILTSKSFWYAKKEEDSHDRIKENAYFSVI